MTTPPYGSPRTRPTTPGVRAVRPGFVQPLPPPAPTPAAAAQTVDTKQIDWEDDPISGRPTVIPSVDPASFDLPSLDDPPSTTSDDAELDVDVEFDDDHVDTWRAPPGAPGEVPPPFQHAQLRQKAVSCPPPMSFDELDAFDSPLALAGERPTLPPVGPPPDAVEAPQRPPPTREERLADEMRARYAVGDFSGALSSADALLALSPSHREALKHAESCREVLCQMYTARLGSLVHVPTVVMSQDKVRWLSLDHRAGFLLACVDGFSSVEEILDVCGMSTLDALRILADLCDQKVIEVASR